MSDIPDDMWSARRWGDTVHVELWYPRSPEHATHVEIDLIDVRATDGLRITYDFDRNGWSVQQASVFEWDADDPVCDPDWQEVAFVPSWKRLKKDE